MQKISDVLIESEIPQIIGHLIKYNDLTDKFEGKCALGVLACESGNEYLKLTKQHNIVSYFEILRAYGVEDEYIYPMLDHPDITKNKMGWDFEEQTSALATIIIRLNDTYNFTFKQIGEFLEVTFDL